MNLRIANKIYKAIGTPAENRYTKRQQRTAIDRVHGASQAKEADRFWNAYMEALGANGRASIFRKRDPAAAFKILMEAPVEKWRGDPRQLDGIIDNWRKEGVV